jgi:hypothetical protein
VRVRLVHLFDAAPAIVVQFGAEHVADLKLPASRQHHERDTQGVSWATPTPGLHALWK